MPTEFTLGRTEVPLPHSHVCCFPHIDSSARPLPAPASAASQRNPSPTDADTDSTVVNSKVFSSVTLPSVLSERDLVELGSLGQLAITVQSELPRSRKATGTEGQDKTDSESKPNKSTGSCHSDARIRSGYAR
jgi:hypothetical protein